jgi:hypothetical protein
MAGNIDLAHANNVIDASLGTAALTATVTPLKLALITSAGTNVTPGTEVTGGGYAAQTAAFNSAAAAAGAASTTNSGTITYTNMPAGTVTSLELRDSSGTPKRKWLGNLTASKTVGAGDTLTFTVSAVVISMP